MGDRRLQVAGHLLWCESALYLQRLKLQSLSCAYRIWETPSKNKHSVLQLLEPHALPPTWTPCLERPWSPIVTMRQDWNHSPWRSPAEIPEKSWHASAGDQENVRCRQSMLPPTLRWLFQR